MQDELMALLGTTEAQDLKKLEYTSKALYQFSADIGVRPDYTQDVAEMQKQGYTWDGYRWVKP